jgi:peptidoglycan-associated lipoprotein
MRVIPLIVVACSALLLAGCPKKPTTQPGDGAGTSVPGEEGASTAGAMGGGVGDAEALPGSGASGLDGPDGAISPENVVYFDFDSSEIRPQYAGVITAHARGLAANPNQRLRLEGHTDERGSREYNIALGERRAQAVRRALLLQGAADAQLVTVSYGEERPAVDGTTEEAFALNRRVEFRPAN